MENAIIATGEGGSGTEGGVPVGAAAGLSGGAAAGLSGGGALQAQRRMSAMADLRHTRSVGLDVAGWFMMYSEFSVSRKASLAPGRIEAGSDVWPPPGKSSA